MRLCIEVGNIPKIPSFLTRRLTPNVEIDGVLVTVHRLVVQVQGVLLNTREPRTEDEQEVRLWVR